MASRFATLTAGAFLFAGQADVDFKLDPALSAIKNSATAVESVPTVNEASVQGTLTFPYLAGSESMAAMRMPVSLASAPTPEPEAPAQEASVVPQPVAPTPAVPVRLAIARILLTEAQITGPSELIPGVPANERPGLPAENVLVVSPAPPALQQGSQLLNYAFSLTVCSVQMAPHQNQTASYASNGRCGLGQTFTRLDYYTPAGKQLSFSVLPPAK